MKEATILFFKMIEQHPEICPHRYEWKYSEAPKDGKKLRIINVDIVLLLIQ